MTDEPIIEGEAHEVGTEVVTVDPSPSLTLFRTSDPVEVLERASRVADALKGVIVKQQLFKVINGKPHVFVEAWATCGAMLGLTSYVVWSRPFGEKGEHGHDWEARVEVHALDGRVISAAEAMCTRKESKWKTRDDYAVRSMAQTRATSKAFRGPLGFIVTLAGYSATPAEEMPDPTAQQPAARPAPVSDVPAPDLWYDATAERMKTLKMTNAMIRAMLEEIGVPVPENVSSYLRLVRGLNDSRRGMVDVWLLERESAGTPLATEPVA
jgi:hypothetical protein